MMKRVVLFVLMVLVGGVVWASTIPTNMPEYKAVVRSRTDKVRSISDEAKFYLVTCEPGEEVYERFGHSGIRVYDPVTGIDEVFHWGLFSFDTPNFVGRFISGNTDYEMGVYETRFFMRQYIERGSSIYAQELDLTSEQKQEFWCKLWENYRPENRKYRYNFIYDNCATRPYQLILSIYNHKILLKDNLFQLRYRDIINQYVPVGSALNTGINLIIGGNADRYMTTRNSVSFPMYTMETLNHTQYIENNEMKSVVKANEVMNRAPRMSFETSEFEYHISIILPLLLAVGCAIYSIKKKRYVPYFTQFMLLVSGLIGVVIFYLWFCSHHPLVDNNMNILWCSPLNIILMVLLFIRKQSLRMVKSILAVVLLLQSIAFLITIMCGVQNSTPQIFALWILMFIVYITIVITYKSKLKTLLKHK